MIDLGSADPWYSSHCIRCMAYLLTDDEREGRLCSDCLDADSRLWAEADASEREEIRQDALELRALEGCEG